MNQPTTPTTPVSVANFRHSAFIAIEDVRLQSAIEGATGKFRLSREAALAKMPLAEARRDQLKAIRAETLANLDVYLRQFEQQATAAGAHVHWAETAEQARDIILRLAQQHGVSLVTKSKSMVTEEIHLNTALEEAGIQPVETDLGEWIIQLAGEPPSHIIGPAIHKTRQQVAALFSEQVGRELPADDIPQLTAEARRLLRQKFLQAGMGISGGNMLIAETGTLVLVENEGNARLTTSAPAVHVALVGIEKMARTWADAAVWLSLLARSATGQPMSIYTSFITGPARAADPDGPQEVHFVLLDNGRRQLLGTPYEEALQCIRCGACLNACPVYREAGGHAYGSPYSGPIGAVISPLLFGRDEYEALPHASSLCGACKDVCPVRIDLPRMLIQLRVDGVRAGRLPWAERTAERMVARLLRRPRLWAVATRLGRIGQRPFVQNGRLRPPRVDFGRDLPPLAAKSFSQLWHEGLQGEK